MFRLLILSTLLLVTTVNAVDHLQFFFHFTCKPWNPSITTWKHFTMVKEWDRFPPDNHWYVPKHFEVAQVGERNTLVHFKVESQKDEWLSAGYKPFLQIRHTCNNEGKIVTLIVWPSKLIPIGVPYTSVHVDYDLSMKEGETDPNNNYYKYDSTNLTHEQY